MTNPTLETAATIATGYRFSGPAGAPFITTNTFPTMFLGGSGATAGVYLPGGPNTGTPAANVPQYFCTNAPATGSGMTAGLRNRCRRAIDAYTALVKSCSVQGVAPQYRGPNQLSPLLPDMAPAAGHVPHTTNVANLATAGALCALPPNTAAWTSPNIGNPATVCPGLLGWFTVVYNACGFTNAPGLGPNGGSPLVTPAYVPKYFPTGAGNVGPGGTTLAAVYAPTAGALGTFCVNPSVANGAVPPAGAPWSWNVKGSGPAGVLPAGNVPWSFTTSRCRKAMDQFGRTASRCHFSTAASTGPAQAGGYSDPLRMLAFGSAAVTSPTAPDGWNAWVPLCNNNN